MLPRVKEDFVAIKNVHVQFARPTKKSHIIYCSIGKLLSYRNHVSAQYSARVSNGMKVAPRISLDLICEHQLNFQWWKYSNCNDSCIACLNLTKSSLWFEVSCMDTKHKKPLCEQKEAWTNIRLNKQHHGSQQKIWHMNMITFPIGRKFICQEQNPMDHFAKFICSVLETVNASSIAIQRVFQYKFSL